MKTLEIKLKNAAGQDVKIHLRLTVGGQRKLKEKHTEEDILSLLLGAFQDTEIMTDIFEAALNYKDNDNLITDGEELYDLLVDNDYCGSEDFEKLVIDIAVNSGILKKHQGNSVLKTIAKSLDEAFNEIEKVTMTENVIETEEKEEVAKEKH